MLLMKEQSLRRERSRSVGSGGRSCRPAPWVGEFLLGCSPIQHLAAALVLLLPLYERRCAAYSGGREAHRARPSGDRAAGRAARSSPGPGTVGPGWPRACCCLARHGVSCGAGRAPRLEPM